LVRMDCCSCLPCLRSECANSAPCMTEESPTKPPDALTFFVVGDIGLAGTARRDVARSMRAQLQDGSVAASFVIATGDNFYGCKSESQFNLAFSVLQREMLDLVPLPWYFAIGNHDIKDEGVRLHTKEWHRLRSTDPSTSEAGWEFRCPQTHFSLHSDWRSRDNPVAWDTGLLDVLFINTNKNWARNVARRVAKLKGAEVEPDPLSWKEQKTWLRDKLASSQAAWKIVVGHHPIELVPLNRLEHGLPGVSYITSGFMKGSIRTRRNKASVKDVVEQGGADVYLCGHQHLMAHISPKEARSRTGSAESRGRMYSVTEADSFATSPSSPHVGKLHRMKDKLKGKFFKKASPDGSPVTPGGSTNSAPSSGISPALALPQLVGSRVDYIIVGSSSRLDQQEEDFELGGPREPAYSDGDSVADSLSKPSLFSDESDVDELVPQQPHRAVPPIPKKDSSGSSSPTWRDKAINGLREKSAHLWHVYKIGYAAITVTPEDMTVRFFTVQDGKAVEEPQGRYVKRRRPQNNAGKAA